jgi:Shikimate 5-dehydrogenase
MRHFVKDRFEMSKFTIIGYPSSHSLSPTIFRAAYPDFGDTYDFIETPSIKEAMKLFNEMGYKGANITSPFKEDVIQYCDNIDTIVSECRASNLIIEREGKIYGYNSDYFGVKSIAEGLLTDNSICTKGVVTGAGGAGRAAALALKHLGFEVTILNRTTEKARTFADKSAIKYGTLSELSKLLSHGVLFVHTTDYELPSQKEIDFSGTVIVEANYKSPNLASLNCNSYISGREWLIHQAIPAFNILTGSHPDIDAMKKIIAE